MLKITVDHNKKVIRWGNLHTQPYFKKGLDWKYVSKSLGFTKGLRGGIIL